MSIHGYAELPLHDGRVPPHLLYYMKRLGKAITMYIIDALGPDALVKKLADPLWFQAFNNVIGMDWDSSGSTTVVLYILKSFANVGTLNEVGFAILGGKGVDAREVKNEVEKLAHYGLDPEYYRYVSKISAKIDGTVLQDGYTLYIHGLVISSNGLWTVVQQGMNVDKKIARRYHIHTSYLTVEQDPHSGIACNLRSYALNLIDIESRKTRKTILDLLTSPRQIIRDISYANRLLNKDKSLEQWIRRADNKNSSKVDHGIRNLVNVNPLFYKPITNISRIEETLNSLVNKVIDSFDTLVLQENVGPELIRALALVADLIYGDTPSFRDPVTHTIDPFAYAFAHGGKDGIPFPIKLDVMKETIEFLEDAINNANLDTKLKKKALENLYHYWCSLQYSERKTIKLNKIKEHYI
ncbi:MAG: DUF763 domain-containing protein [Ignisphaera sp.]